MQDESSLILAIDQGTTGTTVLLVDRAGHVVARGYREVSCRYPEPGWVEQVGEELWKRTLEAISDAVRKTQGRPIVAIGIANQRETTLLWDANTGETVAPAIVWQCRRTTAICERLRASGLSEEVATRTGLVIDPYFSATKLNWIFASQPDLLARARRGELRFGTVDSWLIWKLSGGRTHCTDFSNASRTMLYNIHNLAWDPVLLDALEIPPEVLPIVGSSAAIVAETIPSTLPDGTTLRGGIPIAGVAGDQQAALFGQACFEPGMVKATYGTGGFLLMNTGRDAVRSSAGLLTTLACGEGGEPIYALEGSIFIAGAAIQWLRDQLQIIDNAAQSEALAQSVADTAGVYFVPAFVGLGAPYWDAEARGAIIGLTRGVGRAQIVRAALESLAYQTRDIVSAMERDTQRPAPELRVDGGVVANNFLAQFLSDILGVPVVRPRVTETTGLGAAYLAGIATRFWTSSADLAHLWQIDRRFEPTLSPNVRDDLYSGWLKAVQRIRR